MKEIQEFLDEYFPDSQDRVKIELELKIIYLQWKIDAGREANNT